MRILLVLLATWLPSVACAWPNLNMEVLGGEPWAAEDAAVIVAIELTS